MASKSILCMSPKEWYKLHYHDWGNSLSPSKTIFCVHGLTRCGSDFNVLAKDIISEHKNTRVVCPDVVGRGNSSWLACKDDYGYPLYTASMGTLMAATNCSESVDWVGSSMGGLIGMQLAALPNSPIRKLVLNDIGPCLKRDGLLRIYNYVTKPPPLFDSFEDAQAYLKLIHAPFGIRDTEWQALTEYSTRKEINKETGKEYYRLHFDPEIGPALYRNVEASQIQDTSMWALWDNIKCPVMVVRGKNSDLLTEDTLEAMKHRGPGVQKILVVEGVGHAPMLNTPEQVESVKKFLFDS